MQVKSRRFVKEKVAKKILKIMEEQLKIKLKEDSKGKRKLELLSSPVGEVYLIRGRPVAVRSEGDTLIPVLTYVDELPNLPRVVVDMGAVPHICNGADVMAPGISRVEGEFKKGEVVVVIDEKNRRPLAIGLSLVNSEDLKNIERGKIIKNCHHVGDKLWKLLK